METIKLSIDKHNGEERLFAEFPFSQKLINTIKEVPGARWSQATTDKTVAYSELAQCGHHR